MPRNYVYVIIGALALAMASAGVYGMLNVHLIQANPYSGKLPDYTSQLDSLNTQVNSISSQVDSLKSQVDSISSQVNSINDNITSLKMLKTNLADIHEKLADLQSLNTNIADIQDKLTNIANKTSQVPSASYGKILVTLDKSIYAPGNTVHINAIGAQPLKAVQVQLLDSNGFVLMGQTTWADSTGSVLYGLQLSSVILPGQYQIKLTSDQTTGMQPMTVSTSSSATSSGSYTFTAQTDKGIYQGGDLIQITGIATPGSAVTATLQSASGMTLNSGATANSDGTYTIVFSTLSSYESGTWTIAITNLSQTKTLSIYLESAGSSNSNTFTAQTDKTSYHQGDLIRITGTAQPSTTITAVLTSPSQSTYSSSTTANSDGTYTIIFATSSSYTTGNWNVNVSNLGQSKIIYFTIGTSNSSSSYPFTAQTDKSSYQRGDLVQISGSAQPSSTVNAVLVSPSGTTYNTSATANSNGNYVMFFSTFQSYPTGNWYAEVTNSGQTKILSFNLQ